MIKIKTVSSQRLPTMYCGEKKAWGPLWFFSPQTFVISIHEKCEFSPQHSQTKRVCAIVLLAQCQTLLAFEGLAVQDPWWTKCFSRCYRRRGPPPPPIPAPPPPPPPPVYFFTCRLHLPCSMSARNNLPRSLTPPLS